MDATTSSRDQLNGDAQQHARSNGVDKRTERQGLLASTAHASSGPAFIGWQSDNAHKLDFIPGLNGRKGLGSRASDFVHHHRRLLTTLLVSLARILERVDEQLLPSVYLYVGCTFGASPSQLAGITFVRGFVQALASPLGGFMGHYLNRARVIALACFLWAACTALFAISTSLRMGMIVWAFNGVGLALMIPNGQSLVADYYEPHQRGRAFGLLLSVGNFGTMLGTLYATNMGGMTIGGMEGWRFAFLTIAAFSALVGVATWVLARDPRFVTGSGWRAPKGGLEADEHFASEGQPLPRGLASEVWRVLTTPSFLVIVGQGFLGSMPWNAFAFATVYFQLLGWSDAAASAVLAAFSGADSIGALVGGALGDIASKHFPDHGRIAVCQFSVFMGVPLCAVIFGLLPMSAGMAAYIQYAAVFILMGLLISWAATACNNPVMAEIVPAKLRTLVYAFDRSFEGALSAMGAPLVGLAAEKLFGFKGAMASATDCRAPAQGAVRMHMADLPRAHALGKALMVFTTGPWAWCTIVYTLLHWTYPRDKRKGSPDAVQPAAHFSPLAVEEALEVEMGTGVHGDARIMQPTQL